MPTIRDKQERSNTSGSRNQKSYTDTKERKIIIRQYYKQLYNNQLENLEKTVELLEKYKLTPKGTENSNRLVTTKETKKVKTVQYRNRRTLLNCDKEYLSKISSKYLTKTVKPSNNFH